VKLKLQEKRKTLVIDIVARTRHVCEASVRTCRKPYGLQKGFPSPFPTAEDGSELAGRQ
jgi:hypothetical protein